MPDNNPEPDTDDFAEAANKSTEAGIADETAAYDKAMPPAGQGKPAEESEAHPS